MGNIFKIEKILEKPHVNLNLTVENKAKQTLNFQFKFDPYRLLYSGDITDVALSELPSQRIDVSEFDGIIMSHLADRSEMKVSEKRRNSKFTKNSENIEIVLEKEEKDLAEGIRLLRLFNNKVGEPEEDKMDENEEDDVESENKQTSLFLQRDSQDEGDSEEVDLDNTFKSRKALNQIINNQSIPPVIRNLKYGANVLLLALIAISFSDYFVTYQQFNVIVKSFRSFLRFFL